MKDNKNRKLRFNPKFIGMKYVFLEYMYNPINNISWVIKETSDAPYNLKIGIKSIFRNRLNPTATKVIIIMDIDFLFCRMER